MTDHPLPVIPEGTVDPATLSAEELVSIISAVVGEINSALAGNDAGAFERLFYQQAYWKDNLALTYHLRTFRSPKVVTAAFFETRKLRGIDGELSPEGPAIFVPAGPTLQFIDGSFAFKTSSPAARCSGRLLLLPVKDENENVKWKVWILHTKLEDFDVQAEDESFLQAPGKHLSGAEPIETEVIIIGRSNSAATVSARLKALGVESVMLERNASPGDNWKLRYDCLTFHVPTSFCELPYMKYPEEFRTPYLLTKDDLGNQLQKFVETYHLNIITSATVQSTTFNPSTKRWTVKFQTPSGERTAVAQQLIQATGVASQKPYIPSIGDQGRYRGVNLHSAFYKNAVELKSRSVKSVIIVGSANTAFDLLDDCHTAGLDVIMNVRSPTYIVPLEYVVDPRSLGFYDFGVAAADRLFLTLPINVDAALGRSLLGALATAEPDRYAALTAAGFPTIDSRDPDSSLLCNLIEDAGGHYVDAGVTDLIAQKKVSIKANTEPVAFTENGLKFSDGTTLDADAIIWCTGYADKDVRQVTASILGSEPSAPANSTSQANGDGLIGAQQIAELADATWAVDDEAEVRGLWKRHLRLDNYWIMGGFTSQHRYFSRTLALQVAAAIRGILPPAYRDTPSVDRA